MIENIYINKLLKYPLNELEQNNIEHVWAFLNIFKKPFINITDYRNYIINEINKNYTVEEFYFYESILNKLFWNLRWLLYPLFQNKETNEIDYYDIINNNYNDIEEIPLNLLLYKQVYYYDDEDLNNRLNDKILLNNNFYRSFINKLIMVDKEKQLIYLKEMEGSSDIFSKNYFNLITFSILLKRK